MTKDVALASGLTQTPISSRSSIPSLTLRPASIVHVMRTATIIIALFVATILIVPLQTVDAQVFNWAGEWISTPQDVLIVVDKRSDARGWQELVDDLTQIKRYSITIDQTDRDIAVHFPRSYANPLNGVRFPIAGDRTDLLTFGEHWEKQLFNSRPVNSTLELLVTKWNGAWKTDDPERSIPQPGDYRQYLKLYRGKSPTELMLGVAVTSQLGELSYVQLFSRATETLVVPPAAKGSLELVSISPAADARVNRDDVLSADLSYSVSDFIQRRFFIKASAQSTQRDRWQTVGIDIELSATRGRVQVRLPFSDIIDNPDIAKPLRLRFSLQQRVGELGSSISVAETHVTPYR
jgi:hypothetical protein